MEFDGDEMRVKMNDRINGKINYWILPMEHFPYMWNWYCLCFAIIRRQY